MSELPKDIIEKYPDLVFFNERLKNAKTPEEKRKRQKQIDYLKQRIANEGSTN